MQICTILPPPDDINALAQLMDLAIQENLDNAPYERGVAEYRKLWKAGRRLRVRFMGGSPTLQQRVIDAAAEWSQYANIHFVHSHEEAAEIKVSFTPGGSWSMVGTDALMVSPFEPTLNLGWLTETSDAGELRRVVLHEFGHALGLGHEHQNPVNGVRWNRDVVYAYYAQPPNNWQRNLVDTNIFKLYSQDQIQATAFDKHSIMLYPVPSGLTLDGFTVGWNTQLSVQDKTFIAALYPGKNTASPTIDSVTPTNHTINHTTTLSVGRRVRATTNLNVRRSAGLGQPVINRLQSGQVTQVLYGPQNANGLRWWQVSTGAVPGWCAETVNGQVLLVAV